MNILLKPWHLLLLATSASYQRMIAEENEMLHDQLRTCMKRLRRIRLTDENAASWR